MDSPRHTPAAHLIYNVVGTAEATEACRTVCKITIAYRVQRKNLAEICQKKLQIAIFSAVYVRKWWENLEISRILPIFEPSEEMLWLRR